MKHILEILKDKGFESWRYSLTFKDQNLNAKSQNEYILNNKEKFDVQIIKQDKGNCYFYFRNRESENDFSTMRTGGITAYYVKNKDFKDTIAFGLNEAGKPPTLIRPRPNIRLKRFKANSTGTEVIDNLYDDAMNHCLKNEDNEYIFKAMFDKSICFEYDLTKNP